MSIRPIDIQTGVSQTTETSRINHNANNRVDEQQQGFAQRFEKQVELETTQVIQTEKSEYNQVDRDGRNKSREENNKKKKKGKKESANETGKPKKNSTSMYDISI